MPTSIPARQIDSDDWYLLTDKAATIQVRSGICSVWFGVKPNINVEASEDGKELNPLKQAEITYSADSECWCRASRLTKTARVSITLHV